VLITGPGRDTADLFCSPLKVFSSGWSQRTLILRLTRREIEKRYRGSMLGFAWSLLVPLALLGVYTFVFSVVFEARWQLPIEGTGVFALVLFTGLILFNVFGECANRAPSLMLDHAAYIKKLVFPLETFGWVVVLAALFNALVGTVALLLGYLVFIGMPPPSAVAFPLSVGPPLLLALGCTWFLSSLGVYLRDLAQFVPLLVTVALFLSPVLYPVQMLEEKLPALALIMTRLNPLAVSIEEGRRTLFRGEFPHWLPLMAHFLVGWLVAWLGFMWFRKTRKGFADVV